MLKQIKNDVVAQGSAPVQKLTSHKNMMPRARHIILLFPCVAPGQPARRANTKEFFQNVHKRQGWNAKKFEK